MTSTITPYQWHNHNLLQATSTVNGRWINERPITSTHISTDTRHIQAGDIFLALSGENFDGHDYAQMAMEKGAVALIVERELVEIDLPQLIVSDCRLALGQLGAYRRRQHTGVKIIAITGSSGKTTVKEMLASIFQPIAPTLVTRGNLNNDLGVPMMLLELAEEHEFAILELGANHLGEIAYSAELVQPDVACVLNIGTAHLGEFGSRAKIAQAKAEIYQALQAQSENTTAIIPENDEFANQLATIAKQYTTNIIGFGQTDFTASDIVLADFSSEFVLHDKQNNTADKVILPLAGEHNVNNTLAVTACARALGVSMVDIIAGLKTVQPPKGRLYRQQFGKHSLIDDSYNANPHSVRASANVLANQQGYKVMVLGDIGELGESANSEHYQLGADIANMAINKLYTVGEFAQMTVDGANSVENSTMEAIAFDDKAELLQVLKEEVNQNKAEVSTFLFKGSRFMKMETLFEALCEVLSKELSETL